MALPSRKFSSGGEYRFGFNGKENDSEIGGNGVDYDFGARIFDSRIGKWLSVDPLSHKYVDLSPFNFANNNPIYLKDMEGEKIYIYYDSGKKDAEGNIVMAAYEYGSGLKLPNSRHVRRTIRTLAKIQKRGKDPEGIIQALSKSDVANVAIVQGLTWDKSSTNISVSQGTVKYGEKGELKPMDGTFSPDLIFWHPKSGYISSDGKSRQSAANSLLHELGHTYYDFFDPEGHLANLHKIWEIINEEERHKAQDEYDKKEKEEAGEFDTYSDKWLIQKVEAKFGEGKRTNHRDGFFLKTIGGIFSRIGFKYAKGKTRGTTNDLKQQKVK